MKEIVSNDPQIQLLLVEGLAKYIAPDNQRRRISKNPFKVLYSIFLITKTNEEKQRTEHYPSKELIADVAHCARCEVTKVINAPYFKEFCDIQRSFNRETRKYDSNRYVLKRWVYRFFKIFEHSGMMKHFRTKHDWWLSTFLKRCEKWLIPMFEKGNSLKDVYDVVVNKLSTKNMLKPAAAKCLKPADIKSIEVHKAYRTRRTSVTEPPPLPSLQQMTFIGTEMARFGLKEGDINSIIGSFSLKDLKEGYRIHSQWRSSGCQPKSPAAVFLAAIKKGRSTPKRV